jgi:hypothetical protein
MQVRPNAGGKQNKTKYNYEKIIMLHKAKTLKGYKLDSLDGEFGEMKEFYFDDRHWVVRYLVANTGNWLTGREVLISPYVLVAAIKVEQHITVDLSKKQIEESPSWDNDKPVSRQFEDSYHGYYGYPTYYGGPYIWGTYPYLERNPEAWNVPNQAQEARDSHLRSTDSVSGHFIQATDGEIGHVEDFIIDDETWAIRYLVVDTRNWWPGKKVLVSPQWIERVSWSDKKVFVNLTREAIKQSPEYTEESLLTRDYETDLHRHYDLPGYWTKEQASHEHSR